MREPVASSSIAGVGYEPSTRTLEVEFTTGRVYQYFGVPEHVHAELLSAPSVGTFFNRRVRDRFRYSEV